MQILVVKTCDGPVYFRATRNASKRRAWLLGFEQVTDNDLGRYDPEDVARVREAHASGSLAKLADALADCGAVRTESVRD